MLSYTYVSYKSYIILEKKLPIKDKEVCALCIYFEIYKIYCFKNIFKDATMKDTFAHLDSRIKIRSTLLYAA